jgi:hypothetical protein
MYSKGNIVPIKNSASIIQNNLSIYTHPNKKIFTLAIISKNIISFVSVIISFCFPKKVFRNLIRN